MTNAAALREVRLERDGAIATVSIDRPHARNSVTRETALELHACVRTIADDDGVRVLVLRGVGHDFCCGADLKSSGNDARPGPRGPEMAIHAISALLHEMRPVTVAAIRGGCAGAGFGWACACDLRVAADDARFNTAFLDVGVAGDMAVPWSLPRLVGASRARDLSFLPRKMLAGEARDMGLLARVWPDATFEAELLTLVGRLAAAAPLALGVLKSNYLAAERMDLQSFIALEAQQHSRLLDSDDCREAFAARNEKRPPRFSGR